MFLLQVLVAVSIFALVMFLLATTAISDGTGENCPELNCSNSNCGVKDKSDCADDESYVPPSCSCCGSCVKQVGT